MIWEKTSDEHEREVNLLGVHPFSCYEVYKDKGMYFVKCPADRIMFGTLKEAKDFCEGQVRIKGVKPDPEDVILLSHRTTNYILENLKGLDRAEVLKIVSEAFLNNLNPDIATETIEYIFKMDQFNDGSSS